MALETGTFVSDLIATNPPGTDLKSQGDDHLQLIKKVLKNTFPNASKAFNFPTSVGISASGVVAANFQNRRIIVDTTSGPVTLTMPTLTGADDGWEVTIIKALSTPPMFIAPPSGFIFSGSSSLSKTRRDIPLVPFKVMWMGGIWVAERCVLSPVGSVIPFFTNSLPDGYEWPNGQTLVAADYPDYVALRGDGTTPDLKQRSMFGSNLGGADPARITTVMAATMGTAGGHQLFHAHNHGLNTGTQSANHSHGGATLDNVNSGYSLDHTHGQTVPNAPSAFCGTIAAGPQASTGSTATETGFSSGSGYSLNHAHVIRARIELGLEDANHSHQISTDGGGNQQNIPPAMVCNYALVVE